MGFRVQLVVAKKDVQLWNHEHFPKKLIFFHTSFSPSASFLISVKVNKENSLSEKTNLFVVHQKPNVPSLPEPAVGCRTSLETFEGRVCSLDMEDKEEEDLCVGSLPQQRTIIQGSQNRVKQEDEPQRLRPPD